MPEPRDALIDRLSRRRDGLTALAERGRFCVGAAIGTGMAAQSAMRGGADFLLALSAGRMRNIGEPSIAAMLPLLETNALVMSFARQEILPRASVPVFFGAASFHPGLDLEALVAEIAAAGFCGIANFPTAILIDGAYRQFLEDAGLGFNRELELLEIARRRGLATLAYTHTLDEACAAAERGLDLINIDLGWNMGGVLGVDSDLRIEDAALMANTIARAVHAASPDTLCVVEGGPIVNPRQLEEVCQIARVDGYIGGSTIDRVPSESAIEAVTAAFKAIGALHQRLDGLERWRDRGAFPLALWGRSPAAEGAREMFARLVATDHPVLVVGEPGSGRRNIARALHAASPRRSRNLVSLSCREPAPGRLRLDLFGCMAGARSLGDQASPRLARGLARLDDAARGSRGARRSRCSASWSRRWRPAASGGWAARRRFRSMSGSWRRPRTISWPRAIASSMRASSNGSAGSRSSCRRCASGSTICRC